MPRHCGEVQSHGAHRRKAGTTTTTTTLRHTRDTFYSLHSFPIPSYDVVPKRQDTVPYVSRTSIRWDVMTLPKCVRRRWTILLNWRNQGKNMSHLKWRHTWANAGVCWCPLLSVRKLESGESRTLAKPQTDRAYVDSKDELSISLCLLPPCMQVQTAVLPWNGVLYAGHATDRSGRWRRLRLRHPKSHDSNGLFRQSAGDESVNHNKETPKNGRSISTGHLAVSSLQGWRYCSVTGLSADVVFLLIFRRT